MDAFRALLGGLAQAIPGIAAAGAAAGIGNDNDQDEDDDEAPSTYTRYLAGGPQSLDINDT
jgi:hypothetical protein